MEHEGDEPRCPACGHLRFDHAYADKDGNLVCCSHHGCACTLFLKPKTNGGPAWANADDAIRTTLVIRPASLKLNWHRELTKWLFEATTGVSEIPSYKDLQARVACRYFAR